VRFSWHLTRLPHRVPDDSGFDRALQLAELDHIARSRSAQMNWAENFVDLPV
jgi:p-hydroxybenzoate 3-monooxygenase